MAGETPTPTFKTEAQPTKPKLRERIPVVRTLAEKTKQRKEKKAERAARPKFQESTLQTIRQKHETGTRPIALNLDEDKRFKQMVEKEKEAVLQARGLNITELTGATSLTPSEIAKAKADAYAKFVVQFADDADKYAADGFHFAKNKDGTYSIEPKHDLFYITVVQEAQEAKLIRGDEGEKAVYDRFAKQYPNKAGIYARHGEKALKDSLSRGTPTPDANAVPAAKPAEIVTVQSSVEAQVGRMKELAAKGGALTLAEMNEKKRLMQHNKKSIDEARALKAILVDPSQGDLTDEQLKKVQDYDALLDILDSAPSAPSAPAVAETPAQKQQREAVEYQKTRGPQAFGELISNGVNFSKGEQAAMQTLKQKGWTEDQDTLKYIHAGFAEHQRQQAEAAVDKLPAETTDALEKKGMSRNDILTLILGLIAAGVVSMGQDALTSTAANTTT